MGTVAGDRSEDSQDDDPEEKLSSPEQPLEGSNTLLGSNERRKSSSPVHDDVSSSSSDANRAASLPAARMDNNTSMGASSDSATAAEIEHAQAARILASVAMEIDHQESAKKRSRPPEPDELCLPEEENKKRARSQNDYTPEQGIGPSEGVVFVNFFPKASPAERLSPSQEALGTIPAKKKTAGFFDDAADDRTIPAKKKTAGIFDDADEDNTFGMDALQNAPPATTPSNQSSVRADLVAAILGSPAKRSTPPQSSKLAPRPTPLVAPAAVEALKPSPLTNAEQKKKRAAKRVYKARKEEDGAEKLLKGKVDLAGILPEEDCRFLAKELWIVTAQQLEAALADGEETGSGMRQELVDLLVESEFLAGKERREGRHAAGGREESAVDKQTANAGAKNLPDSPTSGVPVKSEPDSNERGVISLGTTGDKGGSTETSEVQKIPGITELRSIKSEVLPGSSSTNISTHDSKGGQNKAEEGSLPPIETSHPSHDDSGRQEVDATVARDVVLKTEEGGSTSVPENSDLSEKSPAHVVSSSTLQISHSGATVSIETGRSPEVGIDPSKDGSGARENSSKLCLDADTSRGDLLLKQAAEDLLVSWGAKIKANGASKNSAGSDFWKQQFKLSGPLSFLIPTCTHNFLASAKIETAYDLLCLRKTETGIVVEMYATWRKICGLEEVALGTIAKNLLAIGTRLEVAIGYMPAATKENREWFGGHAIVLSGAAKEFLFDYCKLFNSDDFIERRTKELADMLKDWRISKGLEPLKGTGKVAMISAWKTLVKEAKEMELRDGRKLNHDEFMKAIELQQEPKPVTKAEAPKSKPSPTSTVAPATAVREAIRKAKTVKEAKAQKKALAAAKKALYSEEFLASIFKKDTNKLLASVGIKNAQQLLDVDKRPDSAIVQAIIRMRRDYSGMPTGSVEPTSCVRLVYDWCQRVKQRLSEIEESSDSKDRNSEKILPSDDSEKKKMDNRIEKGADPIEALSEASRDFLTSIGVTDAEQFLSAKTKTLADSLINYRIEMKMPPLKGGGAVASISGWKAIVRNAAKASGDDRLVNLNAGRNFGIKLKRKAKGEPTSVPEENSPTQRVQHSPPEVNERSVNYVTSKSKFWVGDGHDAYNFELTIRKFSFEKSKTAWFLTYLGNSSFTSSEVIHSGFSQEGKSLLEDSVVPVLQHVETNEFVQAARGKAFCSSGVGVIELGRYGVSRLPQIQIADLSMIQRTMKAFIFQYQDKVVHDPNLPYNVFERRAMGCEHVFFYAGSQMEKGQTVELCFLPLASPLGQGGQMCLELRQWLEAEIYSLSPKDLRALLDYLNDEVGNVVYKNVDNQFKAAGKENDELQLSLEAISELVISRRRMHWLALRISGALQSAIQRKGGGASLLPNVAYAPLWTNGLVSRMRKHTEWMKHLSRLLTKECREEIIGEFRSKKFGDFWRTESLWCPLAKELFDEAIDLFSKFSGQLDTLCSDQKIVDDLCIMVSRTISKVKQCSEGGKDPSTLAQLSMSFNASENHSSNMFPASSKIRSLLEQPYLDCMALCDEEPCQLPFGDVLCCIATKPIVANESGDDSSPVFRDLKDPLLPKAGVDVLWYVQTQVVAVAECAALSGIAHLATAAPSKLSDIRQLIRDAAAAALDGTAIPSFSLEARRLTTKENAVLVPRPILRPAVKAKVMPDSAPIFLSIVWPLLKDAKWTLEAGASPSSVTYYPPGRKKDNKRSRLVKQEAAVLRGKYARRTTELGLGYIPKLAKRMFINCATGDEDAEESSNTKTVAEALRAFEKSLGGGATSHATAKVKKIVEHIGSLFEIIAPTLLYEKEAADIGLADGARWVDILGSDHLMRLLLVMPKMLEHSSLSGQQLDNTLAVVKELIDFLVQNEDTLFGSSLQLPREEYETNYDFPKSIMSRLGDSQKKKSNGGSPKSGDEGVSANLKEIVLPSDRNDLTDFVLIVLDQLIVCRATSEDLRRKGRRSFLSLGTPGLVCRHCLGQFGEGKYFYSNVQSLSTAATSIDKHLVRCPKTSQKVKAEMVAAKSTHAEQKGNTPSGAQSAFFVRLWERLKQLGRTSAGAEADMYVTLAPSTTAEPDQSTAGSLGGMEFSSHVDIVAYLHRTPSWSCTHDFSHAMDKYYSCLAWGGTIYRTAAMPPNFSSEWVLAKLGHETHG